MARTKIKHSGKLPPRHYSRGPLKLSYIQNQNSSFWRDIPFKEVNRETLFENIKASIDFNYKHDDLIYAYRVIIYGTDMRSGEARSATIATMTDPNYKAPKTKAQWESEPAVSAFYDYIDDLMQDIADYLQDKSAYFEPEFLRIVYMGQKEKIKSYRETKEKRSTAAKRGKTRAKQRQQLIRTRLTKEINKARQQRGLPKLTQTQRRKLHAGKLTSLELLS